MNQLNGIKITTYFGHALHWIKLSQNFDRKIASMMNPCWLLGKTLCTFQYIILLFLQILNNRF